MNINHLLNPATSFHKEYDLETWDILEYKGYQYWLLCWPEYKVHEFISALKPLPRQLLLAKISQLGIREMDIHELAKILKYYSPDDEYVSDARLLIINHIKKIKKSNGCKIQ